MWLTNFVAILSSTQHDRKPRMRPKPSKRRLVLEALEDRCLLSYNVLDLGAFTGYGLNNVGQAVGYNGAAVLWQNGTVRGLGAGPYSDAYAINDTGQAAGYGYFGGSSNSHAFVWDAAHGFTDLGTLPYRPYSQANDVNGSGQAVGVSKQINSSYELDGGHAFLWDAANGMQDLGFSTATAINASGQVVGYSEFSMSSGSTLYATQDAAYFRDGDGTLTALGTLPGLAYSKALDINDLGEVVGSSGDVQVLPHSITYRPQQAFLWQNGVMTSLGVPAGYQRTEAVAINNAGQVVCMANPGNFPSYSGHPFLWDNGVWTDLGFSYAQTVDINNNGQIVVAQGGAQGHSFLLTPADATHTFALTGFPSPTTAGTPGSFTVTARNGPDIDTSYTGTVWFSSSDPQAVLPAAYTFTAADAGVHTFGATLKTAGARSIAVADTAAGISGSETGILVNPAAASRLRMTGPTSVSAGAAFNITVTALDAYGNVATGYLGNVHLSSSDGRATLPANYTFTTADAGTHTFAGLVLRKKGAQSITVIDMLNSALTDTLFDSVV